MEAFFEAGHTYPVNSPLMEFHMKLSLPFNYRYKKFLIFMTANLPKRKYSY